MSQVKNIFLDIMEVFAAGVVGIVVSCLVSGTITYELQYVEYIEGKGHDRHIPIKHKNNNVYKLNVDKLLYSLRTVTREDYTRFNKTGEPYPNSTSCNILRADSNGNESHYYYRNMTNDGYYVFGEIAFGNSTILLKPLDSTTVELKYIPKNFRQII